MCKKTAVLTLVVTVAAFVVGCPAPPPPPFDTTGTYIGTWQGRTDEPEKEKQEIVACPLTITLTQDVSLRWPADHGVKGTVEIDYSCIELPDWLETPPPSTVQVTGLLADDETLGLLSGGCGTGMCLVLAMGGPGVDEDQDGLMDNYSGDWAFGFLLAGIRAFGVSGTFEVAAVDVIDE